MTFAEDLKQMYQNTKDDLPRELIEEFKAKIRTCCLKSIWARQRRVIIPLDDHFPQIVLRELGFTGGAYEYQYRDSSPGVFLIIYLDRL